MDNYAAHKHPAVRDWLAANPRIHAHFTPTHASWMNMVECWFGMAERQAIHRGSYRSVRDLTQVIRAFIDGWNDRAHLHLDPDRRRSPREGQAPANFKHGALAL
jgi:transposase